MNEEVSVAPERSSGAEWLSQLLSTFRWIVISAGLSGTLLALGFLVETSYQHRLGFNLREPDSISGLALEGGRFLLAALEVVLASAAAHPVYLLASLVLIAFAVLFRHRLLGRRLGSYPAIILLIVGQLTCLTLLDLPAIQVNGLLVHGLAAPSRSSLLRSAWLDQVCARVDDSDHDKLKSRFDIECKVSADQHRSRTRDLFALNVLTTVLLSGLAAWLIFPREDKLPTAAYMWLAVLILTTVLDLLLLPTAYGRTARTSRASESLFYHNLEEVRTQPVHGFILFERQRELALFHKDEKHIWLLPRQHLRLIKIEGERDVVEFLLRERLNKGPGPPP